MTNNERLILTWWARASILIAITAITVFTLGEHDNGWFLLAIAAFMQLCLRG